MKLFDSFGQPIEPEEVKHELVGRDWRGVAIYRDDFDSYFRLYDEWVLDDPQEVYDFIKRYEEMYYSTELDEVIQ